MTKYRVAIARNETTVYYIDVEAEHEGIAEELACDRYNQNDYDYEKVVYGEEEVHSIEKLEEEVPSIDVSKCEPKEGDEDSFSNLGG